MYCATKALRLPSIILSRRSAFLPYATSNTRTDIFAVVTDKESSLIMGNVVDL